MFYRHGKYEICGLNQPYTEKFRIRYDCDITRCSIFSAPTINPYIHKYLDFYSNCSTVGVFWL